MGGYKRPKNIWRSREEREKDLVTDINAFINEKGLVHGNLVDTARLREEDNNLRGRITRFGESFYDNSSIHETLKKLGFKSTPHARLHQDDIEKITAKILTKEQAMIIYEQPGKFDIESLFAGRGDIAKKACEEVFSHSKNYTPKRWKSFIDTLQPQLEHKYGITLSEAIEGKPRMTDEKIGKQLYQWLTTRQNIGALGMKDVQPFGSVFMAAITNRPPRGKTNTKIKFNGRKGFPLAKKIPETFYKNSKEIDIGYNLMSKDEVEWMLLIARTYDPKLEYLSELRNLFGKGIAAVHTGRAWTKRHIEKEWLSHYEEEELYADFRIDAKDGSNVMIRVDAIEAYINDPAKQPENKNRGMLPHSVWNSSMADQRAKQWINKDTIDKKVIITNTTPDDIAYFVMRMEQEANITLIHSHDLRKVYNKSLELLLREEPDFFSAAATNYSFIEKIVSHLEPYFNIIRVRDLIRPGRGPVKAIGTTAEAEIKFIFNTAMKYPDADIPFIREFIQGDIQSLHGTREEERISIQNPINNPKADLRVVTDEGSYLLEVKKINYLTKKAKEEILQKYAIADNWQDGTPIKDKLLIFNSSTNGLEYSKKEFEDIGFTVWNGKEVSAMYRASIKAVLEHQPTFFTDIDTPIPGTQEDAVNTVLGIHQDISDFGHIMSRNGLEHYRKYSLKLVRSMNRGLERGARKEREGRTLLTQVEREYITPFKEFWRRYPRVDLDFIIDHDTLFLDLETAGTNRSGSPIIINGLAYKQGDEMVVHQLVSRTPQEEQWLLEKYAKMAEGKTLVTFSGKWFDLPFLEERYISQGMKPPSTNHIDLRPVFEKYLTKQGYDFPHAKLQTYEKVFLGITRPSDIKGEKIPGLYKEFLYEGNGRAMFHILSHSVPDMITMALMYRAFDEEMILSLPHYHEQASLFEDDLPAPNTQEAPF